jgi:hypothetical protein
MIVGAGYGATITAINAISPHVERPVLYAAVVGGYHFVGLMLAAIVFYLLS